MDLPDGVQTFVPGANLEACIDLAFREWFCNHKDEVKGYFIHLKQQKDGFFKPNGMSSQGDMRYKLEIPGQLAKIITRLTHKDWMQDTQIHKAILREAAKFDPTEKSESFIDFGRNS